MPTDPHQDVLYRELSIVQSKEIIEIAAPVLREVVNYGTHVFVRCLSYSEGEEDVDLAPLALYRHILEQTDAVEVLITAASPSPCFPLLRSSFEALLSLEYITEEEDSYQLRSLSWLAGYLRKRLAVYRSLLRSDPKSEEFLKSLDEDKMVRSFPFPPQDNVQHAIENLQDLLQKDHLHDINGQFDQYDREPRWYQVFGGPSNLRQLARRLNRTANYDVLYRQWSRAAHAQDFSPFLTKDAEGQTAIRGLRDPEEIPSAATFAITFFLDATRLLIDKFHPGETWGNWYLEEVRGRYMKLFE